MGQWGIKMEDLKWKENRDKQFPAGADSPTAEPGRTNEGTGLEFESHSLRS